MLRQPPHNRPRASGFTVPNSARPGGLRHDAHFDPLTGDALDYQRTFSAAHPAGRIGDAHRAIKRSIGLRRFEPASGDYGLPNILTATAMAFA